MTIVEPAKRERKSHVWVREPLDYYIEPEWVSERLFAVERFEGGVVDPACGSGRIVRAAQAAGLSAWGCDIADRGALTHGIARDFLEATAPQANIASNPPFRKAREFIAHALRLSAGKTAMLLPVQWALGDARARWLATTPLLRVLMLTPRPSMPPGAVIEAGGKAGGGTTDFAWFIWLRGFDGRPELGWLHRDAAP